MDEFFIKRAHLVLKYSDYSYINFSRFYYKYSAFTARQRLLMIEFIMKRVV